MPSPDSIDETERTVADALDETTVDDRRQRTRLRELCDEVLASHRVAAGEEVLSADERREARILLETIAPRAGKRERPR